MFLEFNQGTFLWQWFHSWAGLNGMALALIVATLAIVLTKWSTSTAGVKMLVIRPKRITPPWPSTAQRRIIDAPSGWKQNENQDFCLLP